MHHDKRRKGEKTARAQSGGGRSLSPSLALGGGGASVRMPLAETFLRVHWLLACTDTAATYRPQYLNLKPEVTAAAAEFL